MTIREYLSGRRYKALALILLSWVTCGGSTLIASKTQLDWLPIPFFLAIIAAMILMWRLVRCPRCSGPVGMFRVSLSGRRTFLNRPINYCPYCGVSLDEPPFQRAEP